MSVFALKNSFNVEAHFFTVLKTTPDPSIFIVLKTTPDPSIFIVLKTTPDPSIV